MIAQFFHKVIPEKNNRPHKGRFRQGYGSTLGKGVKQAIDKTVFLRYKHHSRTTPQAQNALGKTRRKSMAKRFFLKKPVAFSTPTIAAPPRPANAHTLTWEGVREGIALTLIQGRAPFISFGLSGFIKRHHEKGCTFDYTGKVFRLGVAIEDKHLVLVSPSGRDETRSFLLVETAISNWVKPKHRFHFGIETDAKVVATGGGRHLLRFGEDVGMFAHVFMADGQVLAIEYKEGRIVQRKLGYNDKAHLRLAQAEKAYTAASALSADARIRAMDGALHQAIAVASTSRKAAPEIAERALRMIAQHGREHNLNPAVKRNAETALNEGEFRKLWLLESGVNKAPSAVRRKGLNKKRGEEKAEDPRQDWKEALSSFANTMH